MSGFLTFAREAIIIKRLHKKALSKDGDKPANHTNITRVIILIIKESFRRPMRLPKNKAIPENIDRCIPERARIWDRPAFLKLKESSEDVYSFAAQSKAKRRPPPCPRQT